MVGKENKICGLQMRLPVMANRFCLYTCAMLRRFNLRVYGLLINENDEILISDEVFTNGKLATKFPGGGVELGEGLIDALLREFMEETGVPVKVKEHFYTTDFFVPSFFSETAESQIISVYYLVETPDWKKIPCSNKKFDFKIVQGIENWSMRWIPITDLDKEHDIVLPIDKVVVEKILVHFPKIGFKVK